MENAIPVNYDERRVLRFIVRVVAILFLIVGILIAMAGQVEPLAGLIVAGFGGLVLAVNEVRVAALRAGQHGVVPTSDGFRWIGRSGEEEIACNQITAIRISRQVKYSTGIPKGLVRRFEVWTGAGLPPLKMVNRLGVGENDPLSELIARITEDLKQRTAASLAEGGSLEGEGWQLGDMQLIVVRGRRAESISFAEIDFTGFFDGKFCVWRQGEIEAAMRIAPDTRNAPVLMALLGEWVEHRRETAEPQPGESEAATGLGRLLFSRRNNITRIVGVAMAVVIVLVGLAVAMQRASRIGGMIMIAVGLVLAKACWREGGPAFCCYERGVSRRRGRKDLSLLFDDMDSLTCVSTRMFIHGGYAGTHFSLTFEGAGTKIQYATRYQNSDDDLEELRDHVARLLAARMLDDLQAGQTVPWLADATFLPGGLEIRRSRMLGLGSRPPEVVPYGEIRAATLETGNFSLFCRSQARAVLSKPASTRNFFPGYVVLLTILSGKRKICLQ